MSESPRDLLAQADRERAIANAASYIRTRIRLFEKPVVHHRSGLWGWWRDKSTRPDPKVVEVLSSDVTRALYLAAGIVWHEADSDVPGRSQYFDDEQGPEESRYNIVPVKTKGGRFSCYAVHRGRFANRGGEDRRRGQGAGAEARG